MENYAIQTARYLARLMKLTFYTVLLISLSAQLLWAKELAGQVLEKTRIDIRSDNKSLKSILKEIEAKTTIRFTYNDRLIDRFSSVNVNEVNQSVAVILQNLLTELNLGYIEKKHKIIIVENSNPLFKGADSDATSFAFPVKGKVTDEKGGMLPGVSVHVKGTNNGTATSGTGEFLLNLADTSRAILVFSYIGYETLELPLNGRTTLNVAMVPSSSSLKEVVVSYGTQKKRDLTGSIAQVNGADLKDMPVPNVGQRLQGKIAGVQINQNTGRPGAEMSFRIRGAASINAGNNPLIVIDGFPSESGLQSISPEEIESITVLKDASASSLYGSRAANGVILVTTRQAKYGQKSLDISTYTGLESVSNRGKPDVMNAQEFAQYKKEYYEDAARYEGYTGGVPAVYQNPEQYANKPGTDWYDVLLRKALTQQYNVSFSSGTEHLQSVTNLSYSNQQGVILNSWDQRVTARTNNIYKASDRLTIGFNLSAVSQLNQVTPGLDNGRNLIQGAFLMDPTLKYKNDDGTYPLSYSQPGMFPNANYYLVVTQRTNKTKQTTAIANAFAELKLIDGLKVKTAINVSTNNQVNRYFSPSTAQGGLFVAPPQPASGSYNTSTYTTWLNENTLNYKKTLWQKHNFDLLGGYTIQRYATENSNIQGTQFPDDNIPWINAATTRIGNVGAGEWGLVSYIGRFNYNYAGKYLLSLAFRRDGSSKFGDNTKYGNFPSISAGWVVSEENFLKNAEAVSLLKIRGSYGKVGNNNIGNYTFLAAVNTNNYVLDGQAVTPGKSLAGIGNSNLTWETSTSYDIGLDLELFKGRISFTYDYYWKKTADMLYGIDIPVQSGFSSITSNIGQFNFWGHEFTVNSRNLDGELKWTTNFNISFDRNKVIKLGTNNTPIGGYGDAWDDNRTAVGQPIGLFYGWINDGVFMTQQEFETQPHGPTSMIGTARFRDVSGPKGVPDGVIDTYDKTWIGNPNPTFIYGLTNNLSYKDFDLGITMAGTVGNDIADDAYQSTENLDGVFNVRKGVANRWRSPENPGNGIYPRTRSGTTADFRNFTTRQVFDGSYLAVKNITLGYSLPLKKSDALKGLRVFASLQNALMISNYPGLNPEVGMNGLNGLNQGRDFTSYPISRVYSLGVNARF